MNTSLYQRRSQPAKPAEHKEHQLVIFHTDGSLECVEIAPICDDPSKFVAASSVLLRRAEGNALAHRERPFSRRFMKGQLAEEKLHTERLSIRQVDTCWLLAPDCAGTEPSSNTTVL
jgi:hypothetical protein